MHARPVTKAAGGIMKPYRPGSRVWKGRWHPLLSLCPSGAHLSRVPGPGSVRWHVAAPRCPK